MTAEFIVAAHALAFLNHKQKSLSSETIAQNVCTNPARIRKVLLKLKNAGLVETKIGAEGGYAFSGDPAAVTLLDVLNALGDDVVKLKWRSGDEEMDCTVASGMGAVMDDVYADLNECCKRKLSNITVEEIDRRLFTNERKLYEN